MVAPFEFKQLSDLSLTRSPGRVHLLWEASESGGAWPSTIRNAASRDGGRSWQERDPFTVPSGRGFTDLQVFADRCGDGHAVYQIPNEIMGSLYHVRWSGDWVLHAPLAPGWESDPGDLVLRSDSAVLIWTATPARSPTRDSLRLLRSSIGQR